VVVFIVVGSVYKVWTAKNFLILTKKAGGRCRPSIGALKTLPLSAGPFFSEDGGGLMSGRPLGQGRGPFGRAEVSVLQPPRRRETPTYVRRFLLRLEAFQLKKDFFIRMPAEGLDRVIDARIKGKVYLLQRLIPCGRGCGGCPHGPYWYGYYRHKGFFVSFYIGKELPRRFLLAERIHVGARKGGDGDGSG